MQRHRERIGEHRDLVGHTVGHGDHHVLVRGHELGEPAGGIGGVTGVDASGEASVVEVEAHAPVADLARRAHWRDAARSARQPRVEHDALTRLDAFDLGADLVDGGDDFVPEHLRERDERGHGAVFRALEVHEHLFGVRPADAGEAGADHGPVGAEQLRLGDVDQRHRRGGEVLHEPRRVVGRLRRHRIGELPEDERFHRPSSCFVMSATPWRNRSISVVLKAAMSFMSGLYVSKRSPSMAVMMSAATLSGGSNGPW